jgi:hypothetical protein
MVVIGNYYLYNIKISRLLKSMNLIAQALKLQALSTLHRGWDRKNHTEVVQEKLV